MAGGFSAYYQASEYYKAKAGKALKKGLISQKAIHESFYGKRNYTKYKDYKEIVLDREANIFQQHRMRAINARSTKY